MVLVLTNDDMERIEDLPMSAIIDAIEGAYRELGEGIAKSPPRRRLILPPGATNQTTYWFNNIMGAFPGGRTMALRIDSAFFRIQGARKVREGDFAGLVLLFDTTSGELVAILHDHYLSTRRVGATGAIAAKYLSRHNSRVIGLFGSGHQAQAQVSAMAAIRPLELVKVYSPNPEHRREFAARMTTEYGVEVRSVDHPRTVVEGSDIVVTATNSRSPVFDGRWLEAGTHVETIVGSDQSASGSEIDHEAVRRADLVVTNLKEQIEVDRQPTLLWAIEEGLMRWEDIRDLAEVVAGLAPGRTSDAQVTLHDNNTGMGIQFAALGALILARARDQDLGAELPTELFMTRGGNYAP